MSTDPARPQFTPIGYVRSSITERDSGPKMESEDAPAAAAEILPAYTAALEGLEVGQGIILITWLHQGTRDYLKVHPRGDTANPLRGVFATRSPDRPNPIGLHRVTVTSRTHGETPGSELLGIDHLEAIDGTPILDIKPATSRSRTTPSPANETRVPEAVYQELAATCRDAWTRGLLSGFNGNVSVRLPDDSSKAAVTCTGAAKGHLTPTDVTLQDLATGEALCTGRPSSESPMHLAVYRAQEAAKAIVHTHPPHLLALSLRVGPEKVLEMALFESGVFKEKLGHAPDHAPGTDALADAVAEAARGHEAVLMQRHGLVCWGKDLTAALGLAEEIENLARIQLLALR